MDNLVLGALDGISDLIAPMGVIPGSCKDAATQSIISFHMLNSAPSLTTTLSDIYNKNGVTLSSLEMILWTSLFCVVLTCILLLLCHLYPPKEMELLLDGAIGTHIQMLRSNRKTLQKVTIKAIQDYAERDLLPMFQELAEFPELLAFAVDLRLPLSMVTFLLQASKKLQDLSLLLPQQLHTITGNSRDIETLAKAIPLHPSLRSISIEACNHHTDPSLDPLIASLAKLPTLQTLSIYNLHSSPQVFTQLFQSNNVQSLDLNTCLLSVSPHQIQLLAHNDTLRRLHAPVYPETISAWAHVIRHNTSISKLTIFCHATTSGGNAQSKYTTSCLLLPIVKALAHNAAMQQFTLEMETSHNQNSISSGTSRTSASLQESVIGPPCIRQLAKSLTQNTCLKSIRIGPVMGNANERTNACATTTIRQDLEQALRQNFSVESVQLFSTQGSLFEFSEIDFLCRCNGLGRGAVLVCDYHNNNYNDTECKESKQKLVHFLTRPQVELSAVFHILSEKPEALCNWATPGPVKMH